jgi:hypothetical protein
VQVVVENFEHFSDGSVRTKKFEHKKLCEFNCLAGAKALINKDTMLYKKCQHGNFRHKLHQERMGSYYKTSTEPTTNSFGKSGCGRCNPNPMVRKHYFLLTHLLLK